MLRISNAEEYQSMVFAGEKMTGTNDDQHVDEDRCTITDLRLKYSLWVASYGNFAVACEWTNFDSASESESTRLQADKSTIISQISIIWLPLLVYW
jgi:hypothetical protein